MKRAIIALMISFLIVGGLGCAFIYSYWGRIAPTSGLLRSGIFIVTMGAVHLLGFQLWKQQSTTSSKPSEPRTYWNFWEAYGESLKITIGQQVVMIIFTSMILDTGTSLRFTMFSAASSWALAIIVMLRRPCTPTPGDLLIVKYGFWLAMPIVLLLSFIVQRSL